VQNFLLPAVRKRGLASSSDSFPRGRSAFSAAAARVPGAGIHFTFKAAEVHIARETAVTE